MRIGDRVFVVGLVGVVAALEGRAQEMINLSPGSISAQGQSVSDGGLVVVGTRSVGTQFRGFRWTAGTGAAACPPASDGGEWWFADAITRSGSAYVGSEWGTSAGLMNIGGATRRLKTAFQQTGSTVRDVSDDGQIVVGSITIGGHAKAARWRPFTTIGTGIELIDPPAPYMNAAAVGSSGDGQTLAVLVYNDDLMMQLPCVWTDAGGYRFLELPPDTARGSVTAISRNGRFAGGRCTPMSGLPNRICRWDLKTGELKVLPTGSMELTGPSSMSEDGSTMIGSEWVYRPEFGVMKIRQAMAAAGVDLTDWVGWLSGAAISPDGAALVGEGQRTDSRGAFLARGLGWCRPTFIGQPATQFVSVGDTARFAVDAGDPAGITYQWLRGGAALADGVSVSGSVISGAQSPVLTISNAGPADGDVYVCRASKSCGSTDSAGARLILNTGCGVVTDEFDVGATCLGGSQECGVVSEVSRDTCGVLKIEYITAPTHCSNVGMRFFLDGVLAAETPPVGPGVSSGVIDFGVVSAGVHVIGLEAIGEEGGCNNGTIETWAGKLKVTYCVSAPGVLAQPEGVRACTSQASGFTAAFDGGGPAVKRWQVEDPLTPGVWRDLVEGDNNFTGGPASLIAVGVAEGTVWITPGVGFASEFAGVARVRCAAQNACGSVETDAAELRVCVSDRNCDREVDLLDFFEFFNCWDLSEACADVDGSGEVDLLDFFAFFNAWDVGC